MSYRLLVELDAIHFLDSLKPRERKHLIAIFEKILQFPANCADYEERGEDGRTYDLHVSGKFAIRYWNDLSDRHIKIMKLSWAERGH